MNILKLFAMSAAFSCAYAQSLVSVEAFDEQVDNPNQLTLRLKLTNNSSDTLENVQAKYFLDFDRSRVLSVSPYYMAGATTSIDTLGNFLAVNINVAKLAPGVFPNSSGISLGVNYTNYSAFNKQGDYSYPNANQFVAAKNIPVFVNGAIVAGAAPIGGNSFAETDALPMAQPFVLPDSALIALEKNQKAKLSWIPVKGAESYVVSVYKKKDKSLVTRQTVFGNSIELDLKTGAYLWGVESYADVEGSKDDDSRQAENVLYTTYIINLAETSLSDGRVLGIPSFAARKDTKLVDPLWGNLAEAKEWNSDHLSHLHHDEEENSRCWAVAAYTLNWYYGGTMTQDEIVIKGNKKKYPKLSPLFYFMHKEYGGVSDYVLSDVLADLFGEKPVMGNGMPSLQVLREAFDRPVPDPVIITTIQKKTDGTNNGGHDMVVDGYAILDKGISYDDGTVFEKNTVFYHYLNVDNDGTDYWMWANFDYDHYLIAETRYSVGRKDARVDRDSDGDGLMDYDEARFGTAGFDSDNDGLNDLDEILAFVKMCKVDNPEIGCTNFEYLDSDGDGVPTYWDQDSDNGGEKDGAEVAAGRNMFDKNDDDKIDPPKEEIVWDVPDDYTIYSLDAMRVNDRTICYDGDGYCKIASESSKIDFAVNIGVESVVGDIYSRGGVWLRSNSDVKGDIYTYFRGANSSAIYIQAGATLDGREIPHDFNDWPNKDVWLGNRYASFKNIGVDIKAKPVLTVSAGQEARITGGDEYSVVKVESGAILKIEPGEIHIGRIQFESGSTIVFTNPGQETIVFAEGSTIWRTKIANENLELVAKGFKLVQWSDQRVNIEGDWAGTIHAARASVVMGQAQKLIYGRFLGKQVTMHQQSRIYRVDFAPIDSYTNIALR